MLFNSFEFVEFFLVVFGIYYLLPRQSMQLGWLILASLIFYGAENPPLVFLLLFSLALNYYCSLQVARGRRFMLWVGVLLNLALLGVFKYGALIERSLHQYTALSRLPLPIGISFFTFEGIMILADARRSPAVPAGRHLARVSLLMTFFPHLVSGPIVKARDFFPQIDRKYWRNINWDLAFRTLTTGYFLKLVVADNLREQTNTLQFPEFGHYSPLQLGALLYAYSIQIFADFAGYSLIAIGLAALFGYRLPENFNFPYIAASFSEFWHRWHISLSTFLRDYLYIPLGGNRRGECRAYFNILVVMGLGGLWHGAAWSYAVWGLVHGLALVVERILGRWCNWLRPWRPVRVALVFSFVSCAWLLFRMPDIEHVQLFVHSLLHNPPDHTDYRQLMAIVFFSLPVWLYHAAHLVYPEWLRRREHWLYGFMIFLLLTNSGPPGDFIYFQF